MTNIEKYGFESLRSVYLDELDTTLHEFSHIKSGASLIFLDREDENKTFAIGFSTPPSDDTGVFHIIEHSVLCGSKKYPLNDPFAELLKGSLNTFLNAITFEDRTVYPVSSRCEKDFLNLVDVYLDAVFAPNMLSNPSIFKQEGWHYEYDRESNSLSYNGVVYNEMKGAYSSPDELGSCRLRQLLFPGTPYCKDSGGNPSAIPDLTYEQFKAAHAKYYHPSCAKIILDGRIDLDKVLPVIDSHLSGFNKRDHAISDVKSQAGGETAATIKYEISENESESGRVRALYGYVFADYSDREAALTAAILSDILCGSNASPLKKALLECGLAKNVEMYASKSRDQMLTIEIRDTDEENLDKIDEVINTVIRDLATNGINKKNIISSLNSIEFRLRERDYGTLPTGIVLSMSLYGDWMYDNQPEKALLLDDVFASIREKIDSDYFERELMRMTLDNQRKAKVIMLPDKTLAQRSAEEERVKLDSILSGMSDDEKQRIIADEEALRLWQSKEPSEDEINSLPTLSLGDIPATSARPFASDEKICGVKVIRCPVKTNGIAYLSLLFDASDLKCEEFVWLSMLASALVNFPTENHNALSLQNDIKENLGGLFASFAVSDNNGIATPFLKISAKSLVSKTDDLIRLIGELLLTTKIEDEEEIGRIVAQLTANMEDSIISSGESVALGRVEAGVSEAGAIAEYLSGYEAYRILKGMRDNKDAISALTASVSDLLKKLVDKSRLIISVVGDVSNETIEKLISIFPSKNNAPEKKITPTCAGKDEFFLLPSKVAYAVLGGKSVEVSKNLGLMRVARSILSYEYLWNTVRVQGGAYGVGFVPRRDGGLSFYSYRDPSPTKSIEAYKNSSAYLRSMAEENEDITKFIIGAIGEYDTLITPRTASNIVTADYLNGWTREAEEATRAQMLDMTSKDLLTVADIIDSTLSDSAQIVVGGSDHLASFEPQPEKIIKI
ncbi:MAG: insulinase family protein [Clostridia bacterium]|nr:insulinase family protein [Clostridia bacterium]